MNKNNLPKPPKEGEIMICQMCGQPMYPKDFSKDEFENMYFQILINPADLYDFIGTNNYQASLFLEDIYKHDEVIAQIEKLGYATFSLKDAAVKEEVSNLLVKIIQLPMIIIFVIAIFFITYFVMKLILKSRNKYYAILRMLGMSQRKTNAVLNIELFIDAHIVYAIFIAAMQFIKNSRYTKGFIVDLANILNAQEYVILYMIVMAMILVMSRKFAKQLFSDSAMTIYREEV